MVANHVLSQLSYRPDTATLMIVPAKRSSVKQNDDQPSPELKVALASRASEAASVL